VLDLFEIFKRLASDPLCRRVRGDQLWTLLLQRSKLGKEPVILQVGDLGRGEDIVLEIMVSNLGSKLLDPTPDVLRRRHLRLRRRDRRRGRRVGSDSNRNSSGFPL